MEESWLTGNRGQGLLSLTDFAAFLSFGSQAWGTSEPGSRPCLAPYPKQASNKIGMGEEDSPEGRGRGSYSPSTQLALVLKTTALPHAGAPPLRLAPAPICSNRLCCGQERRRSGRGEMANRWETNQRPQAHLKEIFISSGGVVIPGAFQQNVNPSRAGTGKLYVD